MTPRQREERRRAKVLDKFRNAAKKVITMSDVRAGPPPPHLSLFVQPSIAQHKAFHLRVLTL